MSTVTRVLLFSLACCSDASGPGEGGGADAATEPACTRDSCADGGGGEGEATSCRPPRVAVETADGRLRCAEGCAVALLGPSTWCTTPCEGPGDCAEHGVGFLCDSESDVCVRSCDVPADCRDVGLTVCDLATGSCR